jgi:hypothetical protein
MKFRALNFDYQREASVHEESSRKSRDVLFIRQASQIRGDENFEPTSTTPAGAVEAKGAIARYVIHCVWKSYHI